MTAKEIQQVEWHLSILACRTYHGCLAHLRTVSCDDLRLLCRAFDCDLTEIAARFWLANKGKAQRSAFLVILNQLGCQDGVEP